VVVELQEMGIKCSPMWHRPTSIYKYSMHTITQDTWYEEILSHCCKKVFNKNNLLSRHDNSWWPDLITHLKGSNKQKTGGIKTGKGNQFI
jgi:hypothetical protein